MNKNLEIQLNNPFNVSKQVALFGIEDMHNIVGFETIASNLINDDTISLNAGQTWYQTKDANEIKITVKFVNDSEPVIPSKAKSINIYDENGTLIGASHISNPSLLLNHSQDVTVLFPVKLEKCKTYRFDIRKISGTDDTKLAIDTNGNYANGQAFSGGMPLNQDLYFKIDANVLLKNVNVDIPTSNYKKTIDSLRLNPQNFNNIKVISNSLSQRLHSINVLLKDSIGNINASQLQTAAYSTNKDAGNLIEVQLKEPILLGEKELKYTIEPNTDVTLIFSNKEAPKENKIIVKKDKKKKIFSKETIADFKRKNNKEKVKIIAEVVGISTFLYFLIRKIIL